MIKFKLVSKLKEYREHEPYHVWEPWAGFGGSSEGWTKCSECGMKRWRSPK